MVFPASERVTDQVTDQVINLITSFESKDLSLSDIMMHMNMKHKNTFRKNYLYPAINLFLLEMTIPDKPNSRFQKYRLTKKGKQLKVKLLKQK